MLYLENWIHQIVGQVLNRGSVDRAAIDEYQSLRLRQTLQYACERSPFYRQHFRDAGVSPNDIHSAKDLSRLPFTEPHNLSDSPYLFLCVSQSEIARPHTFVTSGTTGPQKKVFWTQRDLDRIIEFMAAGIGTVADEDDVVQILLADGRPYSQADLLYRGVKKLGAKPVICGMEISSDEQLRILEASHTTVLFGYTGQIFRLSKDLQSKTDLAVKGVQALFLAGAYVPSPMRLELEGIWNCGVYTHYGLTEMGLGVAVECNAHASYHFNEAGLLAEVVDPETGNPVADGEEGELVFTTLAREAMPLIRYRTHDLTRILPDPCPCGATSLRRLDHVRKRLESMVHLSSGDHLYPSMLDDALYQIPGLVDYQAVLIQHGDKSNLKVEAEMQWTEGSALQRIRYKLASIPAVARSIASGIMAEPEIAIAAPGKLRSGGREKKLLVVRTR
jgi:phenylacetate-CoA ligase